VAGGLVHGAFDAGAVGVVGLEGNRLYHSPGAGLGSGQVAEQQRELSSFAGGAQAAGRAGPQSRAQKGDGTGVLMTRTLLPASTWSNVLVNLLSRSRIRI
jgi:hypothetical protein